MQVFLTGASGYIGGAVAEALMKAGHFVIGLARSDEQARKLEAKGMRAHRGDLRDHHSIAAGARQADAVIHTGNTGSADAPQVDRAVVDTILHELATFHRPFIYTSGCWVLGNTGGQVADEDTPLAPTPISAWRAEVEKVVLAGVQRNVAAVVLRPAMVYGRGGGLVNLFVESARETGAARMVGDGANRWACVNVDDLADAYVRALAAPAGTVLYAAHGPGVRMRDIAEAASRAAGADGKVEAVPLLDARKAMGVLADALALDQQISGERAQKMLGWRPHAVSIVDDLARAQV